MGRDQAAVLRGEALQAGDQRTAWGAPRHGTRAVESKVPPRYARAPAGSKLDPFGEWICDRLREDPAIQSQRLRELAVELGYEGGKSIFDDYVREVRPRFVRPRTFQRTVYRPGELVQCDFWEPSEHIPVGHGQTRRGWVVTAEVCWSRVIAGSLIFSKEPPDILWGLEEPVEATFPSGPRAVMVSSTPALTGPAAMINSRHPDVTSRLVLEVHGRDGLNARHVPHHDLSRSTTSGRATAGTHAGRRSCRR